MQKDRKKKYYQQNIHNNTINDSFYCNYLCTDKVYLSDIISKNTYIKSE